MGVTTCAHVRAYLGTVGPPRGGGTYPGGGGGARGGPKGGGEVHFFTKKFAKKGHFKQKSLFFAIFAIF